MEKERESGKERFAELGSQICQVKVRQGKEIQREKNWKRHGVFLIHGEE